MTTPGVGRQFIATPAAYRNAIEPVATQQAVLDPEQVDKGTWDTLYSAALDLTDFNADYYIDREQDNLRDYSTQFLARIKTVQIVQNPRTQRQQYRGIPLDISDKVMELVRLVDMKTLTIEKNRQWKPKAEQLRVALIKISPHDSCSDACVIL